MSTRFVATLLLAVSAAVAWALPAQADRPVWTTSPPPPPPPPPPPTSRGVAPVASPAPVMVPTAQEVRAAGTVARPVVAAPRDRWEFSLRLPVWVPGLSGTLASGTSTIDGGGGKGIADRLFDATTDLRLAFTGGFVLAKGPWEIQADGFYVSVGTEVGFTLNDQPVLTAGLEAMVIQGSVGYRVGKWGLGQGGRGPCLSAFALAGVRYYGVGFWAETGILRVDRQADWADPIVGTRLDLDVSRYFSFSVHGDVGGFGVGSDLSWSAGAAIHWHFAPHWQLIGGWNILDVEYAFGAGDQHFQWNLQMSGPLLALQYDF